MFWGITLITTLKNILKKLNRILCCQLSKIWKQVFWEGKASGSLRQSSVEAWIFSRFFKFSVISKIPAHLRGTLPYLVLNPQIKWILFHYKLYQFSPRERRSLWTFAPLLKCGFVAQLLVALNYWLGGKSRPSLIFSRFFSAIAKNCSSSARIIALCEFQGACQMKFISLQIESLESSQIRRNLQKILKAQRS